MTRSKLITATLALATLLPCLSIIASSHAAAHPSAGGPRRPTLSYSRVPAGSWGSYQIRRVIDRIPR